MHNDKILMALKTYLQRDNVTISKIERFLGGMSNYTYHVVANNQDYVVRIANEEGRVFVNYPSEKLHLFLVEPYNITSKTLFYDTVSGVKISEYLPGETLVAALTDEDIKGVALLLHKLHRLPLVGLDYDQEGRFARYEALIHDQLSNEYYELKTNWLNEKKITYAHITPIFTHGDAQRSNIIRGHDGTYHLLDFEFAGQNDPFFDIASFGNINFNDSLTLLDYYLERKATESEKRRMLFNRMFQVLQWHLVAFYKHEMGQSEKLHIDFAQYSANYLTFAHKLWDEIKTLARS